MPRAVFTEFGSDNESTRSYQHLYERQAREVTGHSWRRCFMARLNPEGPLACSADELRAVRTTIWDLITQSVPAAEQDEVGTLSTVLLCLCIPGSGASIDSSQVVSSLRTKLNIFDIGPQPSVSELCEFSEKLERTWIEEEKKREHIDVLALVISKCGTQGQISCQAWVRYVSPELYLQESPPRREAERRPAERAVLDNMKAAYVSVLAPSQLGAGIDYVLIHGVRLIAEKLGPRAAIVHTNLRNAYNEAWRRTIIQRHIDCSPLHHVIPALLASLSTDSYLIVDDHSAPLRSEDGVQQGAPLATTSFCVAIHPEVQQCDTTLEVNDAAARFNADDGFLVSLPEHVWLALHAFRTSIKASVGLEVRFDKMQAYCADMEAARREAPADIEWPELDGHHGIAVLNVPLGSPEYVQAYMRGKAEELREEVDASLSKLLSAKPSRRYTHALHHHAWALLKHCMQHKAEYWLRNCLPSEVEAFAEAVDATIFTAVERVLGVSFDPSTYGTDTNPVVTDFLAELLHDPDPMAAEVATLSEDAVARARNRLHLPTRLKGAGIRRMATVCDAAFIGCMNAILPRFLTRNSGTNTPTHGFFDPPLGSVLGRGSFNATSSARQYDHFLNDAHGSDSYAAEMRAAWGRIQAATAGHLGDANAGQMEREVEAASGSQKELTAFIDLANNSRLRNEVCALPATCRERILFNQLDAASGMWTVAIPTARIAMTPHELREVAAGYFFLPSPCLALVVGSQIILPSTEHNPVTVDLYIRRRAHEPAGAWRLGLRIKPQEINIENWCMTEKNIKYWCMI
eukprot:jgi/Tetstr1/430100/TSEL_001959.t2